MVLICLLMFCMLLGVLFYGFHIRQSYERRLNQKNVMVFRYKTIINVYDLWMQIIDEGKSISDWLIQRNINTVAVYGMADLGIRLCRELKSGQVNVLCGIDRSKMPYEEGLSIIHPDEKDVSGEVDAVIVTALITYDQIEKDLTTKGYKKVIAFDELIYAIKTGFPDFKESGDGFF